MKPCPGCLSTSFRRQLLDADLARAAPLMRGVVLDVGGKRVARRGEFRPPEQPELRAWWVLNVTPDVAPHVLGSAQALPLCDASADAVLCTEVIEHLEDPAHALGEFRRVTKPGGDILLTTPNSYAWLFRLIALFGLTPQRIQRPDHKHFFDEAAIVRLAPDADVFGYFPYVLIKRTIRRGVGALSPTFVLRIHKTA